MEKNFTVSANKNGKYGIPLPPGKYTLKIDGRGYYTNVKIVDVNDVNEFPKVVVVTLKKNLNVLGIPRLAFVILTGEWGLFKCFFFFFEKLVVFLKDLEVSSCVSESVNCMYVLLF